MILTKKFVYNFANSIKLKFKYRNLPRDDYDNFQVALFEYFTPKSTSIHKPPTDTVI